MRVLAGTLAVEFHHLFEGGDAAVVHVGGRKGHAAERRRLEPAAVFVLFRHFVAAEIERLLPPAYVGVVELLIGEIPSGVTLPAAAAALEEPQALLLTDGDIDLLGG